MELHLRRLSSQMSSDGRLGTPFLDVEFPPVTRLAERARRSPTVLICAQCEMVKSFVVRNGGA